MEIQLTADQETRLAQIARDQGNSDAAELLRDTALRLLNEDEQFRAAVLDGKACADRGDFMDEEEMDARFEQMLRS